jgi:hypothetical protein
MYPAALVRSKKKEHQFDALAASIIALDSADMSCDQQARTCRITHLRPVQTRWS